ncbi:MAG: nuclear transport factor 2 family protein [Dehalococcoidia bacterium]|nr:nuclear transport factor 2 family protein [Dehalococcoidia bacterium]
MDPVAELLEIEAVRKLRVLYSHYFDIRDVNSLAGLFAEDAVCEFGESYGGDWVGRDAIRKGYANYATADAPPFSFMHAVTNAWVELTGPDTARGRAYLLDLNLAPGVEQPLLLVGVYDDLYRKIDGRWYITRTRIDFLWPRRDYHGPRS